MIRLFLVYLILLFQGLVAEKVTLSYELPMPNQYKSTNLARVTCISKGNKKDYTHVRYALLYPK